MESEVYYKVLTGCQASGRVFVPGDIFKATDVPDYQRLLGLGFVSRVEVYPVENPAPVVDPSQKIKSKVRK